MEYRQLGCTELRVSALCLGTMTWGEQNTEAEAHAQLDYATGAGINFIDTAEMYPVPPRAETYGRTESYLGSWLKSSRKREQLIIATKVTGRTDDFPYLRDGKPRLNRQHIEAALHDSLRRLQTDYIDLYQVHWPERHTNYFGRLGYVHDAGDNPVPLEETLGVLGDLVASGKVRHIGISNETPWGAMRYLELSRSLGLPRVISIQNPYSLLNRSFEIGLAEISHREALGLFAYSPLGFGVLSGKYLHGAHPPEGRLTRFERFRRYTNKRGQAATEAYVSLARSQGLSPAQMALAYVTSRPFVTSTIIGATTLDQLAHNIDSADLHLSEVVLSAIDEIHHDIPNPCP